MDASRTIEQRLLELIGQTFERRGKVVIPAFAVGRTQEIVYSLHRLALSNRLPDVPVFVDSPLAVNVTEAGNARLVTDGMTSNWIKGLAMYPSQSTRVRPR